MQVRALHPIVSFSSYFLLMVVSSYPSQAAPSKSEIDNYARENGFRRSDYPYFEPVNQCGGEGPTSAVPDQYEVATNLKIPDPTYKDPFRTRTQKVVVFRADFRNACNNHDRCYMTAGKARGDCDAQFARDLMSACRNPVILEPVSVTTCVSLAQTYAGTVSVAGAAFFPGAQDNARKHKTLVENFISGSGQQQVISSNGFQGASLPSYLAEMPMFDPKWYLENNSDVNNACKGNHECAKKHYLKNGLLECRNASPSFNPRWYLDSNPDVKNVFVDCRGASEHWSGSGRAEGRQGAPSISSNGRPGAPPIPSNEAIEAMRDIASNEAMRDIAQSCSWRFGRTNGELIADRVRLEGDGTLTGYSHENERGWDIQNGDIVFLNGSGQVTSRFERARFVDSRIVLTSQSLGIFAHTLTCQ